jgi:hypothetical protein
MLRFSGELVSFLDLVDFESKQELLKKVKQVREDIAPLPYFEREVFRKMLSVAVQGIYYTSEAKLLKFKNHLNKSKNK